MGEELTRPYDILELEGVTSVRVGSGGKGGGDQYMFLHV